MTNQATIGPSDAPIVMGISGDARALWRRLRGEPLPEQPPTPDMQRDAALQPIILRMLCERLGRETVFALETVHRDWPWAHAQADAFLLPHGARPPAIVQVLAPRPGAVARALIDGPLAEWTVQVQHQLAIYAVPYCFLAVLDVVSWRLHQWKIEPDAALQAELARREKDFWDSAFAGSEPAVAPRAEDILDTEEAVRAAQVYVELESMLNEARRRIRALYLRA